jgi:hypothetical protein
MTEEKERIPEIKRGNTRLHCGELLEKATDLSCDRLQDA